ncbi:MAG: hypothetical protein JXA78_01665 [Anaerolineales bacterium]|nr:hypothetical protein [Anaerolineales bacterium]
MMDKDARMQVLEMIESGRISAEEGLSLLQALAGAEEPAGAESPVEAGEPAPGEEASAVAEMPTWPSVSAYAAAPDQAVDLGAAPQVEEPARSPGAQASPAGTSAGRSPGELPLEAQKWRRWWMIPLWIGAGVTALGGALMYWAMQASGMGFWFVCASLPFALGVLILALAFQSRVSPWLHLRVQQAPGEWPERIAFSFPILAQPMIWFLRAFGRYIPKLEQTSLDEVILAISETTSPETPIYIQVDDDEDGEKVEIYIG